MQIWQAQNRFLGPVITGTFRKRKERVQLEFNEKLRKYEETQANVRKTEVKTIRQRGNGTSASVFG